jgi:hypothetical protein
MRIEEKGRKQALAYAGYLPNSITVTLSCLNVYFNSPESAEREVVKGWICSGSVSSFFS